MAKNVRFGDKGLDKLVEGINVVGDAVKVRTCRVSWVGMAVLSCFRTCMCVACLKPILSLHWHGNGSGERGERGV